MQLKPFEIKGDMPQWQMVYDVLDRKQIDDIVTYNELTEALGRDFLADRGPFYKAQRHLLEQKLRALAPIPTIGYQVVQATDHERLARKEHRSGRRKIRKAKNLVQHADRTGMAPEVRQKFDALEGTLSRQEDAIRRIDIKTQRHEAAIKAVEQKVESGEDRLARLERLEEALRSKGLL